MSDALTTAIVPAYHILFNCYIILQTCKCICLWLTFDAYPVRSADLLEFDGDFCYSIWYMYHFQHVLSNNPHVFSLSTSLSTTLFTAIYSILSIFLDVHLIFMNLHVANEHSHCSEFCIVLCLRLSAFCKKFHVHETLMTALHLCFDYFSHPWQQLPWQP